VNETTSDLRCELCGELIKIGVPFYIIEGKVMCFKCYRNYKPKDKYTHYFYEPRINDEIWGDC
jgi:hypothetical protein